MAWYSNSSSWDWNAEGVIVSSHASGIDHCNKPAVNDWPSDTEFFPIKRDGPVTHTSRGLCSSEVRTGIISQGVHVDVKEHGGLLANRVLTPAMADMLVFDGGEVGYGNIVPMGQGKVPIVTTCIGNGAFIRCSDHVNGSLESIVRKGLPENQGSAGCRDTQGLKPEIQYSSFAQDQQCAGVKFKGKGLHVSPTKRLTDGRIERTYNGDRTSVTNEQRSSPGMGSAGSGDSLTGLQLGKRTYSQDVTTLATAKAIPKTSSVSKKARTGVTASQIPRCQVEGCKLDLTSAKDYHRRHKVCEPHSKAGKVVVASLEQRFCQQCSRFHVLTEFDEAKRSCRRRLAGHNKRRRKPQPDPLELQARLRSSLEDWSFLHQPRYPRLPLWQDAGDNRSSALWPRKVMHYEDQPTFDHSLQTFGTDVYMKGLSPSLTRDKFPLLLLHSPKTMMPMDTCDTRVHHQYIPGLVRGPVSNGLTLASSPMGAGVFTGLQTTPVTEVTRVSDSGCALSLLSLHMQCTQAPDMVSLDLSGLANTTVNHDQHVQEGAVTSQQVLLQGRHQYCDDFSTTLSMAPNLHLPSTADVHEGSHVMVSDKDFYECSFINNLNRQNGYEGSHSMVVNMQGHETTGQVKQTQDLMHMASFQVPNSPSQRSSMVFNLESSALGDSHFSHESSFLKF